MKQIFNFYKIGLFIAISTINSFAQMSSNTVRFQITYDTPSQKYTVWVVPSYDTPNANNADTTERGATAQVALRVPKDFVISDITAVRGDWDKSPLRLGPNEPKQSLFNNLNPAYRYYVVGKSAIETNYGRFTKDKAVALFTFKGNGCFGAISILDDSDEFVILADKYYAFNVKPSFYSKSGQKSLVNAIPLEQFSDPIDPPAFCCSSTASFGSSITFTNDRKDICIGEKMNFVLKNIKGIGSQNIKFVLSTVEPINETEAYNSGLQVLGTVQNAALTNNKTEATLSNVTMPTASGRYFVIALIDDGSGISNCKSFTSSRISINASPTAKVTPDKTGIICAGDKVTFTASPADFEKYEWLLNNNPIANASNSNVYTASASGAYSVKVTNKAGCSGTSQAVEFSTILVSAPSIRQVGEKLVSSTKFGNQWFLNSVAIAGATDSVYVPKTPGSYAVQTTSGNCKSALSASFLYAITALDITLSDDIVIFPNPTSGEFEISVPNLSNKQIDVVVSNLTGSEILKKKGNLTNGKLSIKEHFPAGTYIIKIQSGINVWVKKLIRN